jgi:hypothetical protein
MIGRRSNAQLKGARTLVRTRTHTRTLIATTTTTTVVVVVTVAAGASALTAPTTAAIATAATNAMDTPGPTSTLPATAAAAEARVKATTGGRALAAAVGGTTLPGRTGTATATVGTATAAAAAAAVTAWVKATAMRARAAALPAQSLRPAIGILTATLTDTVAGDTTGAMAAKKAIPAPIRAHPRKRTRTRAFTPTRIAIRAQRSQMLPTPANVVRIALAPLLLGRPCLILAPAWRQRARASRPRRRARVHGVLLLPQRRTTQI